MLTPKVQSQQRLPLDIVAISGGVGGDYGLFRTRLDIFQSRLPLQVLKLRWALREGNIAGLSNAARDLAKSFSTFAATDAADLALRVGECAACDNPQTHLLVSFLSATAWLVLSDLQGLSQFDLSWAVSPCMEEQVV
jgi:hypothetical protein